MQLKDLTQEWLKFFEVWAKSQNSIHAPEMDYVIFLQKIVAQKIDSGPRIFYFFGDKLLGWATFIHEGENAQFTLFEYEAGN